MVRVVTGWQGSDGPPQGGGWGQPQDPYGGDPYGGNPYGDPYGGNPYGGDPYGGNPYGQTPYGQGAYGQPQYGQQGGFGQPGGFGFDEPPKRSKLPIVLSVIAIVAVVGAVVTIVLLNRGEDPAPAASTTTSTSAKPSSRNPSTPSRPPSRPSTGKPKPGKDGWKTIENPAAELRYQVPEAWKESTQPIETGIPGIQFGGVAEVDPYQCGGKTYTRGFVASGDVQAKDGGEIDLNKTVTDFARALGQAYYSATPKVDVPAPKGSTVDEKKAAALTAKVTQQPTAPECQAATGEVAIVGILLEEDGKPAAVAMLAVVNDLSGGPATPASPPDELAEDILTTVGLLS
jgi:hypothetical protein